MKKIFLFGLMLCVTSAVVNGARATTTAALQGDSRANVYYREGVRYALEGRLDEAAAAFEQVVELDPHNGDAYYSLGNVYSEQRRWGEAVIAYRHAVNYKKKDGEAYNGLGIALAGWGQYELAVEAFERAIKIYPEWAEPHFHLSRVYNKLGQNVAAEVAYSEAIKRRPDYAAHPPRSFTTEAGKPRVAPRREETATVRSNTPASATPPRNGEAASKPAARPATTDAGAQYDIGVRHSRAGRYEEAVTALRQAVRLDRNNAAAYSALGNALARLERWRESVDAYEQAVRLDPKDANAYEMLGRSYAKLRETTPPAPTTADGSMSATGIRTATTSGASSASSPTDKNTFPATTPQPGDAPAPAARNVAPNGASNKSERPASVAASMSATPVSTATDADPTAVYRVGPGDVLEVRPRNAPQSRPSAFEVTQTGLLDYPLLGVPLKVTGLTTDEIESRLSAELKRRGVAAVGSEVSVGVREYASHAIIVSGLVKDPGTKILRREGVPLYVIVAHALPLPEAGQVVVVSQATGRSTAVDLSDAAAMKTLVRPGDVLNVWALPKQFYYIAGTVRQPGQKQFHAGLTLTQAIMAAGGVLQPGATVVAVARQGVDGRLVTTRYNLDDIEEGRASDPLMQPGDRIEVLK